MDNEAEIRDFLTSRRARLTPEQARVPRYDGVRRVPGLRREEVAHLAGVSVDYYTRLERGRTTGASVEVLESIARALQLDDVEREHLMDLVRASRPAVGLVRRPRSTARTHLRPGLQAVVDSISVPAFVQNARHDLLATNTIGRALFRHAEGEAGTPFNHARFVFLDPRAHDFFVEWDLTARNTVALLRTAAGHDPHDESLSNLVGLLSTRSERFRTLWASHDVLKYRYGPKRFHHPEVGDLEFGYESFELSTDPGLILLVYTVEAGSPTQDALRLLGSLTAEALEPARQH